MKSLVLCLLLAQLSLQAPTSQKSPPYPYKLVSRAHQESPHVVDLKNKQYPNLSRRQSNSTFPTSGNSQALVGNLYKYLMPVTVAGQTVDLEVDTGSADTWIVHKNFECYQTADRDTQKFSSSQDASYCNMGQAVKPDASFQKIDQFYQFTCYGQGGEQSNRCVKGKYFNSSLEIAGVEIQNAIVGFPKKSSFPVDGQPIQSGLLGLGMSGLTAGWYNTTAGQHYPPIMNSTFFSNQYNPPLPSMFSFALSRDSSNSGNAGKFTLGGIPSLSDPSVNVSSNSPTSAPFQIDPLFSSHLSDYSIKVDGFALGNSTTISPNTQVLFDTGADVFEVPSDLLSAVYNSWSEPVQTQDGYPVLSCNATLTQPIGLTIGGRTYYMQGQDLLLPNEQDPSQCILLVVGSSQDAGMIIGDPFLKNVLAVFDWQGLQMSFYPRMYYQS